MIEKNSCDSAGTGETPIKHQLVQLFWMLGPSFTRWAESHMHQEGMTPQRLRLLGMLLENGPMMMGSLRNEMGVTATNITALVDALEKDDMVTRKPHVSDRRATMIELTPKAEKKLLENCTGFKDRVSEIFSDFNNAEQCQLLEYLDKMRKALIARNILKESDLCPKARAEQKKLSTAE